MTTVLDTKQRAPINVWSSDVIADSQIQTQPHSRRRGYDQDRTLLLRFAACEGYR
jgi:hypothetical protein